ncbi:protein phosphatase 1D [Protopterus annectens]|uniref:protein phosphatase 1D n=1 Tax=Protopterus annectens TaxID=7888 RepID=UPI001CF9F9CD|nr:protein phosphatase 1D [Protopterus annectens]
MPIPVDSAFSLKVSVHSDQGGRKYMEDVTQVIVEHEPLEEEDNIDGNGAVSVVNRIPNPGEKQELCFDATVPKTVQAGFGSAGKEVTNKRLHVKGNLESTVHSRPNGQVAFFAVYDGHGGREAAQFARDNLWECIKKQRGFLSKNQKEVCAAIRKGFIACHNAMWKKLPDWPKTVTGLPSTSGTTASVVIIRGDKMYVAHVGDSGVVFGVHDDPTDEYITAVEVTQDHKPELPKEKQRIERLGGSVVNKSGVHRVVWKRPKLTHFGPVRRSTVIDQIPFLAVARALGDLWSYDYFSGEYVVSPEPDISVHTLDFQKHKYIILGSDGLWNMVSPQDAVFICQDNEEKNSLREHGPHSAKVLVNRSLARWRQRMLRADNTSTIVISIASSSEKQRGQNKEELQLSMEESPCANLHGAFSFSVSPCATPPMKVKDEQSHRLCYSDPLPSLMRRNVYNKRGVSKKSSSPGDSARRAHRSFDGIFQDPDTFEENCERVSPAIRKSDITSSSPSTCLSPSNTTNTSSYPKYFRASVTGCTKHHDIEKTPPLNFKRTLEESNCGPAMKKIRRSLGRTRQTSPVNPSGTPNRKSLDKRAKRWNIRGQRRLCSALLYQPRKTVCVC